MKKLREPRVRQIKLFLNALRTLFSFLIRWPLHVSVDRLDIFTQDRSFSPLKKSKIFDRLIVNVPRNDLSYRRDNFLRWQDFKDVETHSTYSEGYFGFQNFARSFANLCCCRKKVRSFLRIRRVEFFVKNAQTFERRYECGTRRVQQSSS